ncbi:unnamed protein product [Moneuplotes crassus]|uniref:Transmembrane protein n=2 Tax=Euplotes crassus TaxID=5936 RepID=A0AAD2D2A8_EUPCR|nr:unnamed protein product [Moneuplotes crassus]
MELRKRTTVHNESIDEASPLQIDGDHCEHTNGNDIDINSIDLTEWEIKKLKREARKKKWVKRLNICTEKLHALIWVLVAAFVIYKTNFFRVIWEHPYRNIIFLDICVIGLTIYLVMVVYLTLFLPIFRGIENWEEVYPNVIPFLSIVGVVTFFSSFLAFFPIWGFLTVPIILVIFMGYSMSLTFLPGGYFGTLLALLLLFGMSATSHYIPHEGHWQNLPSTQEL